jgi:3-oxoacyl-[acyl-carrier protein] reductase
MGEGKDIAAAVAFLSSDAARYITGQTLHVNGGMAMI